MAKARTGARTAASTRRTGKAAGSKKSSRTSKKPGRAAPSPEVLDLFETVELRVLNRIAAMKEEPEDEGESRGTRARKGAGEKGSDEQELPSEVLIQLYTSEGAAIEIEYLRTNSPPDQAVLDLLRARIRQKCSELRLEAGPSVMGIGIGVLDLGAPEIDEEEVKAEVERLKTLDWEKIQSEVEALKGSKGRAFAWAVKLGLAPHLAERGIHFGVGWLEETGRNLSDLVGMGLERAGGFFRSLRRSGDQGDRSRGSDSV